MFSTSMALHLNDDLMLKVLSMIEQLGRSIIERDMILRGSNGELLGFFCWVHGVDSTHYPSWRKSTAQVQGIQANFRTASGPNNIENRVVFRG